MFSMKRCAALLFSSLLLAPPAMAEIIGTQADRAVTEEEMKASLRQVDLVDDRGAPVDLRGLLANGKPTLVSLWAYWCPNCLAEMAGFKAIAASCPTRWNIVFVSARAGDHPKDRAKFTRYGLPWKIYRVGDSSRTNLAKAKAARAFYGATKDGGVITPLHYLLSPGGDVEAIVNGRMNFAEPERLAAFCSR
jgi:thiol-disulfide isomerase/thioredoxin